MKPGLLWEAPAPSIPCTALRRRTLADIIMEKLTEKQTEVETVMSEVSGFPMPQLDPRVLEVYRGVREVRARGTLRHAQGWCVCCVLGPTSLRPVVPRALLGVTPTHLSLG